VRAVPKSFTRIVKAAVRAIMGRAGDEGRAEEIAASGTAVSLAPNFCIMVPPKLGSRDWTLEEDAVASSERRGVSRMVPGTCQLTTVLETAITKSAAKMAVPAMVQAFHGGRRRFDEENLVDLSMRCAMG